MPAPYDYLPQPQDPFASVISGLRLGTGIAEVQAAQQARQMQQMQQEQALRQAEEVRRVGAALIANPNPTARDFVNYSLLLPKDQSERVIAGFKELESSQKQNQLQFGGQVLSALSANQPQEAVNLLRTRAEAEKNAGRPDQARVFEDSARFIEVDPKTGFATVATYLAVLPGGEKVIENAIKVGKVPIELRTAEAELDTKIANAKKADVDAQFAYPVASANLTKAQQEAIKAESDARFADLLNQGKVNFDRAQVNNLISQINDRTARLRLDEPKIQAQIAADLALVQERLAKANESLTAVPAGLQPDMNKAFVASATAKGQEEQFNSLASRITGVGTAWGRLGSFNEWIKKSTGSENAITELRQEYNRLRNTAAIQSLPPGPATDKDIQLALAGFPSETGNPQVIASFLRGVAKLKAVESAVEGARGEWMANNKGLLTRATKDFIAGDFTARAGETFPDLTKRIADQVSKRYLPTAEQQRGQTETLVQRIPGQTPTTPTAPTAPGVVDIMKQADLIISGGR